MIRVPSIVLLILGLTICSSIARSMYVNGFSSILGNSIAENTLLQYAQDNQISTLLLYELHLIGLPDPAAQTKLADFIHKAKNTYGISKVGAIAENAWFFTNRIDSYNNSRSLASEKFDIYNLEFEFWNTPIVSSGGYYCTTYLQPNSFPCDTTGAFNFFMQELQAIHILAQNNSHSIETETYVGWLNEGQAKEIRRELDRVLLHAYVASPITAYDYAEERLMFFAADNQLTDISIIFSAEPSFMQTWLENNSMQAAENIFSSDYNTAGGAWQTYINLVGFTYFTYSYMTNIALPVEWGNLSAKRQATSVQLRWCTWSEHNSRHFEVERSSDGSSFSTIGRLRAAGESHETLDYLFFDESPLAGQAYYRVKQVDFDGRFECSKIVSVEASVEAWSIFPNPARGSIEVRLPKVVNPGQITCHIVSMQGTPMKTWHLENQIIDLSGISEGLYFLKCECNAEILKLVILK